MFIDPAASAIIGAIDYLAKRHPLFRALAVVAGLSLIVGLFAGLAIVTALVLELVGQA